MTLLLICIQCYPERGGYMRLVRESSVSIPFGKTLLNCERRESHICLTPPVSLWLTILKASIYIALNARLPQRSLPT
jgi:hypothetical protein